MTTPLQKTPKLCGPWRPRYPNRVRLRWGRNQDLISNQAPLNGIRITQGDLILVSLRDFQDEKADVIMKYNADEGRTLKSYGEIPEGIKINEDVILGEGENDDGGVEFGEIDIDEI